jgi:hypothetical protein
MAIGKSFAILICVLIASVAFISILSIAQKDSSTDPFYDNGTTNGTITMAKQITTTGAGVLLPLSLIVAILALGSVLMIFRSKKK